MLTESEKLKVHIRFKLDNHCRINNITGKEEVEVTLKSNVQKWIAEYTNGTQK